MDSGLVVLLNKDVLPDKWFIVFRSQLALGQSVRTNKAPKCQSYNTGN